MQKLFIVAIAAFLIAACGNNDYSPKPRGYHRIVFPEKEYELADIAGCPFSFEKPIYSVVKEDDKAPDQPCWKNLEFPQFNSKLHLSYYKISPKATLDELREDARTFVFKHTSKASAIDQASIFIPEHNIQGLEYIIQGNTASNYQFYLTDGKKNYLRGALYFNEKPNLDSIQPVLDFLKKDIKHLIHTVRWK